MPKLFVALLSSWLLTGCAVVQKVDTALDCKGICERYQSCFDSSYDTAACAARCRASASEQPDFRRKADMCMACISERSCVQATFACVSECVSVVP
ncbi:MAG: hypothetical protein ACOZQL_32565 [Myxococcota bacterium]